MPSWAWIGAVLLTAGIGVVVLRHVQEEIEYRRLRRRVIQGAIDGLPVIRAARAKMEARRRLVIPIKPEDSHSPNSR